MVIFNTWQFNLAGYLVSVVVFYQFYKLAVRNAVKDGAATITLQLLAGLASLVLVPFFAIQFPTEPKMVNNSHIYLKFDSRSKRWKEIT